MADAELFQIGEVAKMYHLSVGTLRHYEQAGLLKPEFTDPVTGYRYYSVRQFERLTNIRYLRALGLPLGEIAEYLNNRNVENIEKKLEAQRELVRQKQRELALIERKIDKRLVQLREARSLPLETIQLVKTPACRIVGIRESLQYNSYLWLEGPIRQIEKDQKVPLSYLGKIGVSIFEEHLEAGEYDHYDQAFLLLDAEDVYEGRTELLPEGICAQIHFRGSHGDAPAYYERLMGYLRENELTLAGPSREIALIDNCISDDPETFVTEIRIPVQAKA